jgi:hypothetical protein
MTNIEPSDPTPLSDEVSPDAYRLAQANRLVRFALVVLPRPLRLPVGGARFPSG